MQRSLDVPVELLDPPQLQRRFPWLNVEDLAGGSLGLADEGWFDAYAWLQGFRRKARSLGVREVVGEVVGVERDGDRVVAVRLADGTEIEADWFVNAAGPRAADVARMVGIELPVRPRKRFVYHVGSPADLGRAPLTIDPTGVYFRPEGPRTSPDSHRGPASRIRTRSTWRRTTGRSRRSCGRRWRTGCRGSTS